MPLDKVPEAHAYIDGASNGSRGPGGYGAVLTLGQDPGDKRRRAQHYEPTVGNGRRVCRDNALPRRPKRNGNRISRYLPSRPLVNKAELCV
jgi:hypothetical protein